jgi:hypothetical protein
VIRGSCLCGTIHYELSQAPSWAHHCHCKRCRKIRGTPFATNAFVPLEAFAFTQGEEKLRNYKLPEAERFTHAFCDECGSSLPFRNTARGVAVIPMGSLDDDPDCTPSAHIFVGSMASWHTITDSLPQNESQLGTEREVTE